MDPDYQMELRMGPSCHILAVVPCLHQSYRASMESLHGALAGMRAAVGKYSTGERLTRTVRVQDVTNAAIQMVWRDFAARHPDTVVVGIPAADLQRWWGLQPACGSVHCL